MLYFFTDHFQSLTLVVYTCAAAILRVMHRTLLCTVSHLDFIMHGTLCVGSHFIVLFSGILLSSENNVREVQNGVEYANLPNYHAKHVRFAIHNGSYQTVMAKNGLAGLDYRTEKMI